MYCLDRFDASFGIPLPSIKTFRDFGGLYPPEAPQGRPFLMLGNLKGALKGSSASFPSGLMKLSFPVLPFGIKDTPFRPLKRLPTSFFPQ